MIRLPNSAAIAFGVAAALALTETADAAMPVHLTRSMIVAASPSAVWDVVGPFCAIRDWHPAIGSCTQDAAAKPTRTLVTKDGQATFVELQVERNDAMRRYAYSFTSSPVPVTGYVSTISVKANGKHGSIVTWESDYTPNAGQEAAAAAMLSGIYESGLSAVRDRFAAGGKG